MCCLYEKKVCLIDSKLGISLLLEHILNFAILVDNIDLILIFNFLKLILEYSIKNKQGKKGGKRKRRERANRDPEDGVKVHTRHKHNQTQSHHNVATSDISIPLVKMLWFRRKHTNTKRKGFMKGKRERCIVSD